MAQKTVKQQIILVASAAFFFGSTAASLVHLFRSGGSEPSVAAVNPDSALRQAVQGYETVLKREPNNQTALEGLMRSRMAMNDPKGAAEPLAQLIKLNPQRQDYADLMRRLRSQQAGNFSSTNNPFSGSATR